MVGILHSIRIFHKTGLKERNLWTAKKNLQSFKVTNFITASLGVAITIIVIAESIVLQDIKNEMQSLATGGIASVNTKPGPGLSIPTHPG